MCVGFSDNAIRAHKKRKLKIPSLAFSSNLHLHLRNAVQGSVVIPYFGYEK